MKRIGLQAGSWWVAVALTVGMLAFAGPAQGDQAKDAGKLVQNATQVFKEMTVQPADRRIPPAVIAQCYGVAIFPGVIKAGLIIGAEHGNGIIVSHQPGGAFGHPAFLKISGGSIGAQIGGAQQSIILVLHTKVALDRFTGGEVKLGTDITAIAGPTGSQAAQEADVYTYTQVKGAFAGASATGNSLSFDNAAASAFYGRPVDSQQILQGSIKDLPTPHQAAKLRDTLGKYAASK